MNNLTINEYIKSLRLKRNLSINKLGDLSGMDPSYLSRVERGKRNPSPATLEKLAQPLNTTYENLMQIAGFTKPDLVPINTNDKIEGIVINLIRDLISKKIITNENNIPNDIMELLISAIRLEIKLQRDNFSQE